MLIDIDREIDKYFLLFSLFLIFFIPLSILLAAVLMLFFDFRNQPEDYNIKELLENNENEKNSLYSIQK